MSARFNINMTIYSKSQKTLEEISKKHFSGGTFRLESIPAPDGASGCLWWGTPKECFNGAIREVFFDERLNGYQLRSRFTTIYGIPVIPIEVLSKMYPECRFEVVYNSDPRYVNGELIFGKETCC